MKTCCLAGALLWWAVSPLAAAQSVTYPCGYIDKTSESLERLAQCARLENGALRLLAAVTDKTVRDDNGLFWVGMYARDWPLQDSDYYVNSRGETLSVIHVDNGPDTFSEGLVRSRDNGKMGFFDSHFKEVVPRRYDFAWPFNAGRALVCNGCKPQREKGNEHTALVGGEWFYIDRAGNRVSDIEDGPF